ncbi:hypothetical protein A5N56_05185, partial [Streptococcus pneumoniae]
ARVFILFENLFKLRQLPSATSKHFFELTSSVLSTGSKQCFEQSAVSFLVCSLIFIEYKSFNVNEKKFSTKDKSKLVDRIK